MKVFTATAVAVLAATNALSASAAPCTTIAQLEANRKTSIALLDEVFNNKDLTAVDRYIGTKYLQHNPTAPDGTDTFKQFAMLFTNETMVEIGASAAVGDLVWVNTRFTGVPGTMVPTVGLDAFRFEDGKIVEHWDILQREVRAAQTASGRPMFPIQSALPVTTAPAAAGLTACGGDDSAGCPKADPQLEANRKTSIALLDEVFNNKDLTAVDRYIGTKYLQHNPTAPDGTDTFKQFAMLFTNETMVEIGASAAVGDLVWVNTRFTGVPGTMVPTVGLDAFRFEDGKIVEHWDILQREVPAAQTASGRPMFPIQG